MFRITFLLLAALVSAAGVGLAAAGAAQDDNVFSFGDGRYEIEGRRPAGFNEFRYLYLEGGKFNVGRDGRLSAASGAPLKGELYGRRKFRLKSVAFDGERLTFETAAVAGVSFRFEGTGSNPNYQPDLPYTLTFKGRLLKLVNGKKAAEAQVTFGYLEPEF